ncbi:hypothetical protein H8959_005657 [Pygathrix nigripes]
MSLGPNQCVLIIFQAEEGKREKYISREALGLEQLEVDGRVPRRLTGVVVLPGRVTAASPTRFPRAARGFLCGRGEGRLRPSRHSLAPPRESLVQVYWAGGGALRSQRRGLTGERRNWAHLRERRAERGERSEAG